MLRGPVLGPDDAGYDEERHGFSLAAVHRPDLIVGAAGSADVQAAVAYADRHRIPVAVQATGHGAPSPAAGGLLITTRRMAGVTVDPERRTAWIEAGTQWQPVIEAAARHGLAPLSGSSPHVGAVSYTLGGGLGLLGRTFGYAADHVRRIHAVTADAQLREVTPESDPDLFWALCGGRANFGVVTRLEIGLVPVSRIYGGALYLDIDESPQVLRAWRDWTSSVPNEMTSSIALIPFPDVPSAPGPLRGRTVAHVRVAYVGGPSAGAELVESLRQQVGDVLIDTVREMDYTESGSICADPTDPQASTMVSAMISDVPDPALAAIEQTSRGRDSVPCILELRHLGGALSRRPPVPNAVGHRNAQYLLGAITPLGTIGADAAAVVHRRLLAGLDPWTVGRFLNYTAGANATADEVRAAYEPDDYRRLADLKALHDPTDLFRLNHHIAPAGHP
ncbi:FAD-binding oxidoreductase [Phytoactinopolyspora halotolerans]|uniref:FAD-binding oxidoreductase n=2 Tax=Phytoactinopolyspora halotolerans TaxID=1981512 RepID=A0A6L9SFY2_9ACTN|nr:FAD-binding oxidoreductase [Phytoactinopolyspora halotolerans]